ncbi:MAG: thioredoxin domain-containing protein [Patescibacteria group bacterium]
MESAEKVQKIFLLGSIVLVVLIIGGLIWAVFPSGGAPKADGYTFNDDNDPSVGPGEADVIVRIYSDFQCPACRVAEAGFLYALKTYGDKVRFIWKDFPLQAIHQNSLLASNAARCAEAQGGFWEYHDRLYEDQQSWENLASPSDLFSDYAQSLDMDRAAFDSCLAEKKYQTKISDDLAEGVKNGVDATPTFFIGDKKFVGMIENDVWDMEIQAALTAK